MDSGRLLGETVAGRYELHEHFGSAAYRSAYKAFDTEVEVEAALWFLRPELFPDERSRADFMQSVPAVRTLVHPHLIRIFDVGVDAVGEGDERLYLSLQLGTSAELRTLIRAGERADSDTLMRYAESLASALQASHAQGKHHGWLSPEDIVEVSARVKLCGVGLTGAMDCRAVLEDWGGDARYLAPELRTEGVTSAACDWYSLAVILLDLETGMGSYPVAEAMAALAQESPERHAVLASAMAIEARQSLNAGPALIEEMRLAWPLDPTPSDALEDDGLPSVIDEQPQIDYRSGAPTPAPHRLGEVGVVSFLEDDDEETVVRDPRSGAPALAEDGDTVIESDAQTKLEMVSMKPVATPSEELAREEAAQKSPVKPVLRPLSSLAPAPAAHQDLGVLAPPKAPRRRFGYWLYLALAMMAGAATVTLARLFG